MKPSRNAPSRGYAASPELVAESVVRAALLEDIGRGGDLTTDAIVDPHRRAKARIVARQNGVVAGLPFALIAFRILDPDLMVETRVGEGERIEPGGIVAEITARARAILTGERIALNLLCRLSGIATATRTLVDLVAETHAKIADTRKTTPGLRALERYAVACGGGRNHRFGLDDAVLIKDNHLVIAGSVRAAIDGARARVGHMIKVEVEVDNLDQLREALTQPIDAVLLDNMTLAQLAEAVRIVDGRVVTEASGGVTAQNVAEIARTGVDVISIGWLTHSAPALDFGLDMIASEPDVYGVNA
ncbi:MAG TPA: carboxylating nicotinate-nucleotide diphosphorylase [Candidatus Cybelea sp.]|jgi:nicotinate-nucleotide pyrophosphorylase (carboxylating)|nr:carboxylating nicotinate-nucleotide diphosphorylase [Candidatus Cybelea sp.]